MPIVAAGRPAKRGFLPRLTGVGVGTSFNQRRLIAAVSLAPAMAASKWAAVVRPPGDDTSCAKISRPRSPSH